MRFLREVSIRFVGDKELGKKYIPLGRKVLGGVVNRDAELGGLEQSLSRKRYDNGLYIEAGYTGDLPFIVIDVTSLDESKETNTAAMYAVFPQGELNGTFKTSDTGDLPVAPSSRSTGVVPREDGALVKFAEAALEDIFKYTSSNSRSARRADIVWTSTTGASLYCQVEPNVEKYNLINTSTSAELGDKANPYIIYYRGGALLSLLTAHSSSFGQNNNICGVGVFGEQLIYMTRPNPGEPDGDIISVWSHLLTSPGVLPGVRPVLDGASSPVAVDTFDEGSEAAQSVWYNFSGSGKKCVRQRQVRTIVNSGTAPNNTITDTYDAYKEELFFTKDESGVLSFTRSTGVAGGSIATLTVFSTASTTDTTYPNGTIDELFPTNSTSVVFIIVQDELDSETATMSATGRMVYAYEYADDEDETLITLEKSIVSSSGTSTWSDKYDREFQREYYYTGSSPPPYTDGQMNYQTIADIRDHIYSYTQTVDVEAQLIYTARGAEYSLPFTNLTNTYTATQTTNTTSLTPVGGGPTYTSSDVDSASGSTSMDGQQNFLQTSCGGWVAMNLRNGIFVQSSIISDETLTKADDANPLSSLTIARGDAIYRCVGGTTEIFDLPEIEGVGTTGRPAYSYTDSGYDLGVQFKPNEVYFERGMICRTVRGTSGLPRDSSVNPYWALTGGQGRYDFFGFGGAIAVAPEHGCLVVIESYSVEEGGAGWTPYAVLPVCRQAAFTLHFAEGWAGPKTQAVCEKMWRSHNYGLYTSVPTEVAVVGTVEWAGYVTY